MKRISLLLALLFLLSGEVRAGVLPLPETTLQAAIGDRDATFVLIDCTTSGRSVFRPERARQPLGPCSTFKIWNTLIGLEQGVLTSPAQDFWKWDGQKRFLPDWNRDLTLREAFQVSCVPAYQQLARQIGADAMQRWLDRIGYGDRQTSAGLDVFWLPAKGRATILITAEQQAALLVRLVKGELPFSARSQAVLKEVMRVKTTDRGTLYGKTGSGTDDSGAYNLGWFVGYVESGGQTYAFAMNTRGSGLSGKDARTMVEAILMAHRLL